MCILKDYLMILIIPCHTMSYFDPSVFNRSRVRQIYANLLIMSQIYEIQLHKINIYSHIFIQNIYDNEFIQNNTTMSPNCESLYSLFFLFFIKRLFSLWLIYSNEFSSHPLCIAISRACIDLFDQSLYHVSNSSPNLVEWDSSFH